MARPTPSGKTSSRATNARCVRYKITRPRSPSPQVPGSKPSSLAASRIDHPIALRLARSRSGMLFGSGNGFVTRNPRTAGMRFNGRPGLASFPVAGSLGRAPKPRPCFPLADLEDEPPLFDVLSQGPRLKVSFLEPGPLEAERDGLQKSNATLSLWLPGNPNERLPLRRCSRGKTHFKAFRTTARPYRFTCRSRAYSVRRIRDARAGRTIGSDSRTRQI